MSSFCKRSIAAAVLGALLLAAASSAQAGVTLFTFDSAADLTNNFDTDVIAGDDGTIWRTGYGSSGGFPASDGGFVHFNLFNSSNSIAFKDGPQDLISFDISAQYLAGGVGVNNAIQSALDYRLRLYAQDLTTILLDTVLTVDSTGAWKTVTLNVDDVSAIWIGPRSFDGTFNSAAGGTSSSGWWPNIDNVRIVPEPASLVAWTIIAGAGFVAGGVRRRRKSQHMTDG